MSDEPRHVVLLHGLGRTHRSMARLGAALQERGHPTWSRTYPSRQLPVNELADTVAGWIVDAVGDAPVLGVTHSMGGILARLIGDRVNWRSLVMLAPPNQGSIVAARLAQNPLFRWFFGPAGQEMGIGGGDWPAPPEPFGVIAGTRGRSFGNVPSWVVAGMLPRDEENDGTISVEETQHPRMADFATVRASHTWIMNHPATLPLVSGFFETGRFPSVPRADVAVDEPDSPDGVSAPHASDPTN